VNNPGYRGHLLWNPDDLLTLTNFAVRRGWKIGIHAIGERAHRTLLDVYEQVIKENPGLKPGTLVLEHGFLADAGQRASAIRLGIPVTIQHPLLYALGSMLLDGWGNAVPHEEFSGIPPRHAGRKRSLEEARGEESVPGLWTEEGKGKHSSPSATTSLP